MKTSLIQQIFLNLVLSFYLLYFIAALEIHIYKITDTLYLILDSFQINKISHGFIILLTKEMLKMNLIYLFQISFHTNFSKSEC